MREFKPNEVQITIKACEEIDGFEGMVMASGDDEADREAERWVREQLENGNGYAWCIADVTASWAGFEYTDSLGGVSAKDEKDFRICIDANDMIANAVAGLIHEIRNAGWELHVPDKVIEAVVDRCKNEEIKSPW